MNKNETQAPGYMTYREAALIFSLMPEREAAQAIKATANYFLYGTVPEGLDGAAVQVFDIMRADIDRGNEKYQKTVEKNRKNGKKGGRPPKKTNNPMGTQWDTTGNPQES